MITAKQYSELSELVKRYKSLSKSEPNLKRYSQYAITYHSTAIEGSTLTEHEVLDLLDMGKPAKNREFVYNLMVFDHDNALKFVLEEAKNKTPITETLIKEISARVMKNTGDEYKTPLEKFDSSKGDYRLIGVHAGRKTFPDYKKVPKLMKEFVEFIKAEQAKKEINVFSLAVEVHYRFVSIHPFVDGNGRVARLLMNYILAFYGFPALMVFKRDKIKYIDTLYKAQETDDIAAFYDFMFRQYMKFLKSEIKRFE